MATLGLRPKRRAGRPLLAGLGLLIVSTACASALASPETTARPLTTPLASPTPRGLATAWPSATAAPVPTAAPAATATPGAPTAPSELPETQLLFTGDINPGRCVYTRALAAGDMALPYRAIASVLQSADIAIGSLDASISDYNPPSPCSEFHRNLLAPAASAQGLQFAGFDVITVATNHIQDCGLVRGCTHESMLDTLANLRAAGIQPVGAGRNLAEATAPVILTVHGVRFAFVAFTAVNQDVWADATTPGAAPFLEPVYTEAIRQARAQADVVIALPHWGQEFTPQVTWGQALGARAMLAAGATLIIGNHPHHVQAVEQPSPDVAVAYALGNFVFDEQWTDGTQYTVQGLLLRARFRGKTLAGIDLLPIHIHDNFQPQLASPEEAALILQDVQASARTLPNLGK